MSKRFYRHICNEDDDRYDRYDRYGNPRHATPRHATT